jgi:hypothetical protein
VRVLEPSEQADLAAEAFRSSRVTDVRAKDLDSDGSLVADVAGEEHNSHTTAPELTLDHVPVSEQVLKPLGQDAHSHAPSTAFAVCDVCWESERP